MKYARTKQCRGLKARIRAEHWGAVKTPGKRNYLEEAINAMAECRENIWRVRRTRAGNEPTPGEIWAMLSMKQVELFIQNYF